MIKPQVDVSAVYPYVVIMLLLVLRGGGGGLLLAFVISPGFMMKFFVSFSVALISQKEKSYVSYIVLFRNGLEKIAMVWSGKRISKIPEYSS